MYAHNEPKINSKILGMIEKKPAQYGWLNNNILFLINGGVAEKFAPLWLNIPVNKSIISKTNIWIFFLNFIKKIKKIENRK